MRILNRALLLTTFVASFASCKKDEDPEDAPVQPAAPLEVSAFSNLTVGNYWVYERRQVDSLDVDQGTPVRLDSLYVIGDTLLNGNAFTMIRLGANGLPGGVRYYWRDSADCILDLNGYTVFRSSGFDQVFFSDQGAAMAGLVIDYSVSSAVVPISVPAGNFNTYRVLGLCTSSGTFPVVPEWKYPRAYWNEGTGRVKWYDYYMAGPLGYRYELVRYHVQ